MAHVNNMTRKQFEAVPYRESWDKDVECRGIVILPGKRLHDSGYRVMDFVAYDAQGEPICRLAGSSDVLHIEGIGGFGGRPYAKPLSGPNGMWSIDCLPKSRLLRLFSHRSGSITAGAALSSFEVTSNVKSPKEINSPDTNLQSTMLQTQDSL